MTAVTLDRELPLLLADVLILVNAISSRDPSSVFPIFIGDTTSLFDGFPDCWAFSCSGVDYTDL